MPPDSYRAFRGPLRSVQTRHIAFDRSFDQSFFSLLCVFKEQWGQSAINQRGLPPCLLQKTTTTKLTFRYGPD